MTIRKALIALFWLTFAATGFAQNRESDSQTLREILVEIQAIHDDMRVTQRTQIVLTEYEMQQSVVNHATENVDNARAKLVDIQRDEKLIASDVGHAEDQLSEASDPDEKKHIAEVIERDKANIAAAKIEERERTTTLQQMEERLQTAQDSLDNIQNELNAIISRLRPSAK
jgi:hypothetical protein